MEWVPLPRGHGQCLHCRDEYINARKSLTRSGDTSNDRGIGVRVEEGDGEQRSQASRDASIQTGKRLGILQKEITVVKSIVD